MIVFITRYTVLKSRQDILKALNEGMITFAPHIFIALKYIFINSNNIKDTLVIDVSCHIKNIKSQIAESSCDVPRLILK